MYPDLPILALTASRSQDIEERAYAAGMNDIVGKPFKPKELKAKIVQYVAHKLSALQRDSETHP
jgi:CheY-like chemotaxis protein